MFQPLVSLLMILLLNIALVCYIIALLIFTQLLCLYVVLPLLIAKNNLENNSDHRKIEDWFIAKYTLSSKLP